MLTSLLLGVFPLHAKTGRIRMSLRAIKSAHEPVVVGLAGMVQGQPGTGLAGMEARIRAAAAAVAVDGRAAGVLPALP